MRGYKETFQDFLADLRITRMSASNLEQRFGVPPFAQLRTSLVRRSFLMPVIRATRGGTLLGHQGVLSKSSSKLEPLRRLNLAKKLPGSSRVPRRCSGNNRFLEKRLKARIAADWIPDRLVFIKDRDRSRCQATFQP